MLDVLINTQTYPVIIEICNPIHSTSAVRRLQDSVMREVLHILTESGVSIKLVRLIKMCLNETYNKVHIGKYYLIIFLFRMV
jgi:hypothetical protein